ncbi:MAG TPA: NUDIX hydrolase [Pyrinomonadaceae bacterium]|nr:NUDIX hydrolase [Pyrinomonadaceae bacterium]
MERRKHGPWTIKETNAKYRDEFVELYEDRVIRPDGEPGTYATVRMKPGVSVLPVEPDGTIYLTRQFRYALGAESVEAVSGGIDGDASPEESAKKELREELGVVASEIVSLGRMDMDTSIVHCPVDLYLARGLKFTEAEQEGTERIEPFKTTLEEAVELVMRGEITHSPSCVLILKAARYLRKAAK